MHRDRFVLALVATAMIVAGLVALNWPTSLDEFDRWGFRISCGSGVAADYEQAAIASGQAAASGDYVAECTSAIWWRRSWSAALVLSGAALSVALVSRWEPGVRSESRSD